MSTIEKITISLPSEMVSEIKEAIAAGEFTNTSEVIRAALRRWRRARTVVALNEAELRQLILEGEASGDPVDSDSVLAHIREKYKAMSRNPVS